MNIQTHLLNAWCRNKRGLTFRELQNKTGLSTDALSDQLNAGKSAGNVVQYEGAFSRIHYRASDELVRKTLAEMLSKPPVEVNFPGRIQLRASA